MSGGQFWPHAGHLAGRSTPRPLPTCPSVLPAQAASAFHSLDLDPDVPNSRVLFIHIICRKHLYWTIHCLFCLLNVSRTCPSSSPTTVLLLQLLLSHLNYGSSLLIGLLDFSFPPFSPRVMFSSLLTLLLPDSPLYVNSLSPRGEQLNV